MPTSRPHRQRENAEPVTVDVEVTEIDGVTHEADAPAAGGPTRQKPSPGAMPGQGWRSEWAGRVRTLDSRWWPLWVVLGVIGVVLAVTVGLVLALIYLVFRLVFGVIRWIFEFLFPSSGGGGIVRR